MILRARWVVTMDGPPIENGAVWVVGDKIAEVGTWAGVRVRAEGEVIDLGEQVLLPGLINAHCHLDYTALRGTIAPRANFAEWIREITARKAELNAADYLRSIAAGFDEAAKFGTTTIANFEAFPELLAEMPRPPLRTWWFAEMIDIRGEQSVAEIYAKMSAAFAKDSGWLGGLGLAPHAPFTASAKLFAEASAIGNRYDLPLSTHLAESREEMEMFQDGSGSLFDFLKAIGRPMDDCGRGSPLQKLLDTVPLGERWIIAHLNELQDEDFSRLREAPKFHVVHCPRSHAYFGRGRFAFAKLRKLGFNVCLGTDSLASNESLSLFAEMRQMARSEPLLSPLELLQMVTVNAAAALRQAKALGRIRQGFLADLIAIPVGATKECLFDDLVGFEAKVSWLMLNGETRLGAW